MAKELFRRALRRKPPEYPNGITPQELLVLLDQSVSQPAKEIIAEMQKQQEIMSLEQKIRAAQEIASQYMQRAQQTYRPFLFLSSEPDTAPGEKLNVCCKCDQLIPSGHSRLVWAEYPGDMRIVVNENATITVEPSNLPLGRVETTPFSPMDEHTLREHQTFQVQSRNTRGSLRESHTMNPRAIQTFIAGPHPMTA